MTADQIPSRSLSGFTCPQCGAYAGQDWHSLGYAAVDEVDGSDGFFYLEAPTDDERFRTDVEPSQMGGASPWVARGKWAASECFACDEMSIWMGTTVVFPSTSGSGIPAHNTDMPTAVAELYDEARAVAAVSRRAGAALARATLEALLKVLDPDAPKKFDSLDGRIARMQQHVSSNTWGLLTVLRHAGNKSLHAEIAPDAVTALVLDPADVATLPILFTAINRLVDERITQVRITEELMNALPPEVRAAAIQRSDQASQ